MWKITFSRHFSSVFTSPKKMLAARHNLKDSAVDLILLSGVTIHGGPSPERSTGEHVWELHHPEGPAVSRATGRDPGSGCQPGVEECEHWQRRARLAAAAGLCLQLRPIAQDGQISTEVRQPFQDLSGTFPRKKRNYCWRLYGHKFAMKQLRNSDIFYCIFVTLTVKNLSLLFHKSEIVHVMSVRFQNSILIDWSQHTCMSQWLYPLQSSCAESVLMCQTSLWASMMHMCNMVT